MKLSVLDVTPVPAGSTPAQALANTIDLARHAEALGMHRYWVAEHHNAGAIACSAPEILIAEIANATTRIRVGSGGVMLPNHSPLKVAENFRILSAFHPDRIDLGVGRAAGTDKATSLALRQARELLGVEGFPARLEELMGFLTYDPDPATSFGPTKAVPVGIPPPPLFLLGSGNEGAALAASLGIGFAFAHHIAHDGHAEAMNLYRTTFVPSRWRAEPWAILATSVLCAESDAAAAPLVRCTEVSGLRMGQGLRDLPFPSIAEAEAYVFDDDEEILRSSGSARMTAGGPTTVRDTLVGLVKATRADELLVMTNVHDHGERRRSYERLVRAIGGGSPARRTND